MERQANPDSSAPEAAQDRGWHEPPRPRRDLIGRPSSFSPEMVERIVQRLWDGMPVAKMCREPGMPDPETIRRWRREDPEFDRLFRFAQQEGWFELAHQVVEDLEEALEAGVPVERVRLMFDARRWILARQAPEFFGTGRARRRRQREADRGA